MITVGLIIRTIRSVKQIRQSALAEMCSISPAYLSLLESDQRKITPKLLKSVSSALNVPQEIMVHFNNQALLSKSHIQLLECIEDVKAEKSLREQIKHC